MEETKDVKPEKPDFEKWDEYLKSNNEMRPSHKFIIQKAQEYPPFTHAGLNQLPYMFMPAIAICMESYAEFVNDSLQSELTKLREEWDELKDWKEQSMKLWLPVIEWAQSKSNMKPGASISEEVLRRSKEWEQLREENENLNKDLKDQEESFCSMTSNRTAFKFWNEQKAKIESLNSQLSKAKEYLEFAIKILPEPGLNEEIEQFLNDKT